MPRPHSTVLRRVFGAIYLFPGIAVQRVALVAEVAPSTVSHALPALRHQRLIEARPDGGEWRLYPQSWTQPDPYTPRRHTYV